jgi:transcriptional regulator with XRE-family HTH domain
VQLRELRQRAGLSQEQLAVKVGVTASTIYKLESGRSKPSYDTLLRLSKALGVEISEIQFPSTRTPKKEAA